VVVRPSQGVSSPGTGTPAVGVDVQHLLPAGSVVRLARRYYPEAEARLVDTPGPDASPAEICTRLWTYKEAYVKAFGGRLMEGLPVPAPAGRGGPMDGPLGRCLATAVPDPAPGYRAAVAVTGDLPPRLHPRTWAYGRPADPRHARPAVPPTGSR